MEIIMTDKKFKCVLCKKEVKGYGNNPAPLGNVYDDCCDTCNRTKVIPARIASLIK